MNLFILATSGDHLSIGDAIAVVAFCVVCGLIVWRTTR